VRHTRKRGDAIRQIGAASVALQGTLEWWSKETRKAGAHLDETGADLERSLLESLRGTVYITSTVSDLARLHVVCMIFSFGVTAK
jgi:hypothetical protein